MNAKTEELLYVLLWTAERLTQPTWRNLNDGFEAWAWRKGLGRRIAELERDALVERAPNVVPHSIVRLTEAGRLAAIGGRDPIAQWNRPWDGRWRMVIFDVPITQQALHLRLWRNLRRQGFGFLQNSLWITPDPIDRAKIAASAEVPSVEMIIVMEGRPCGGESDAAIVGGAWDIERVNAAYQNCLNVFRAFPGCRAQLPVLRDWARFERVAWAQALALDPFLPEPLLPRGYLGPRAWRTRVETLSRLSAAFRANATPGPARQPEYRIL